MLSKKQKTYNPAVKKISQSIPWATVYDGERQIHIGGNICLNYPDYQNLEHYSHFIGKDVKDVQYRIRNGDITPQQIYDKLKEKGLNPMERMPYRQKQ